MPPLPDAPPDTAPAPPLSGTQGEPPPPWLPVALPVWEHAASKIPAKPITFDRTALMRHLTLAMIHGLTPSLPDSSGGAADARRVERDVVDPRLVGAVHVLKDGPPD